MSIAHEPLLPVVVGRVATVVDEDLVLAVGDLEAIDEERRQARTGQPNRETPASRSMDRRSPAPSPRAPSRRSRDRNPSSRRPPGPRSARRSQVSKPSIEGSRPALESCRAGWYQAEATGSRVRGSPRSRRAPPAASSAPWPREWPTLRRERGRDRLARTFRLLLSAETPRLPCPRQPA